MFVALFDQYQSLVQEWTDLPASNGSTDDT